MCLEVLVKHREFEGGQVYTGYKVYYRGNLSKFVNVPCPYGDHLQFMFRGCELDKWYKSSNTKLETDAIKYQPQEYESGFHILLSIDDCFKFLKRQIFVWHERYYHSVCICEVQFMNVCAQGFQDNAAIVVAKDMMINKILYQGGPLYRMMGATNVP